MLRKTLALAREERRMPLSRKEIDALNNPEYVVVMESVSGSELLIYSPEEFGAILAILDISGHLDSLKDESMLRKAIRSAFSLSFLQVVDGKRGRIMIPLKIRRDRKPKLCS